jgi:WD40 repeat protein
MMIPPSYQMVVDCDVLIAGSGVEKPLEPYNIDHSTHPSCSVRLVFCACPSPDGKLIAVGSGDKTIWVWHVLSGDTVHFWVIAETFYLDGFED